MIWAKLLPWAGYPLAIAMFFFWLDGRENLAAEVSRCESSKLAAVLEAEELARKAVQDALSARIAQLERLAEQTDAAVGAARLERDQALVRAAEAQRIISELQESIDNDDAPISTVCLVSDVPGAILDQLR